MTGDGRLEIGDGRLEIDDRRPDMEEQQQRSMSKYAIITYAQIILSYHLSTGKVADNHKNHYDDAQ